MRRRVIARWSATDDYHVLDMQLLYERLPQVWRAASQALELPPTVLQQRFREVGEGGGLPDMAMLLADVVLVLECGSWWPESPRRRHMGDSCGRPSWMPSCYRWVQALARSSRYMARPEGLNGSFLTTGALPLARGDVEGCGAGRLGARGGGVGCGDLPDAVPGGGWAAIDSPGGCEVMLMGCFADVREQVARYLTLTSKIAERFPDAFQDEAHLLLTVRPLPGHPGVGVAAPSLPSCLGTAPRRAVREGEGDALVGNHVGHSRDGVI